MLSKCTTHTTIPVADMERAVRWYEEKLGFKPSKKMPVGTIYDTDEGAHFLLYPMSDAGKAPQTVMSFETRDVTGEVRDLKSRGVVFEEYDNADMKTVQSIATLGPVRASWFRDSEGNILGLVQLPN